MWAMPRISGIPPSDFYLPKKKIFCTVQGDQAGHREAAMAQHHRQGDLNNKCIFFPVLEAGRCHQGVHRVGSFPQNLVQACPQRLWLAGKPWSSLACRGITPSLPSSSPGILPVYAVFPLFVRTPVTLGQGPLWSSLTSSSLTSSGNYILFPHRTRV